MFYELLDHRGKLSDEAGREVGLGEAVDSYVADVLPAVPDERAVLVEPGRAEAERGP